MSDYWWELADFALPFLGLVLICGAGVAIAGWLSRGNVHRHNEDQQP